MKNLAITNIFSYIKAINGVFITKENPTGLTPSEIKVLGLLIQLSGSEKRVSKKLKDKVAKEVGTKTQVITNYVNRFRKKRVIIGKGFNPLLLGGGLKITYNGN